MNLHEAEQRLIFKAISGSHAYGTATPESDTDYRGIFSVPADHYLSFNKKVEQVADDKNDTVYYTLYRFIELVCNGNPNLLEMLWMPGDCILYSSSQMITLVNIRETFITRRVLDTFGGYAVSQIKRARGQNKLVNNPMPEEKPKKEDFCWIIPLEVGYDYDRDDNKIYQLEGADMEYPKDMPFRPIKLAELGWALSRYHSSAVEHAVNTYRLYYYGDEAKGVFRGDDSADIVHQSIPIEDEYTRFAGILIYHKDAYEKALRDWNNYWGWRQNRNEARWKDQDGKQNPVDYKNLMHCMRLLYSAENIVANGAPIVRFEGTQLQRLRDIRAGKLNHEEILAEAEERLAKIDAVRDTCSLPKSPDFDLVNEVSIKLHKATTL